jgi:surfactin synthase thioesterase subunit
VLDCPITALGGDADRVEREELDAWREQTRGAFELRMFPGGHFFLEDHQRPIAQLIRDALPGIGEKPEA